MAVGAVVRSGMVAVASGEEEEGLVGREGGVEAAEEEDMSVLLGDRERKGSVVSVRCRFARREVKNAVGWTGLACRRWG